ncbi:uncharacterized protein ACRADG_008582 isoform 1-T2 [Cochliomyia hominivorax]
MYKTIRHGENSLQYTILPQNDDFRLEGKIKAGGGGGNAGSLKKSKAKKPKRRSFFAYLGLLFVCTVIIGAVLVPFLVSAECLPNPTEWFLKTKNAFSKKTLELKENVPLHLNSAAASNSLINRGNLALNVGKPVKIINKNGVEKIILKLNKTSTTEAPKSNTESSSLLNSSNTKTGAANSQISITHINLQEQLLATTQLPQEPLTTPHNPKLLKTLSTTPSSPIPLAPVLSTLSDNLLSSSAPATSALPQLTKPLSSSSLPNVPRASLQSSLNQNSLNGSSTQQPTITTRIMQVPLLKSTAKKPAIPPVLVKNLSPIQPTPDTSNLNDILPQNVNNQDNLNAKDKEKENSDWIHSHWPYIDPSTYFQWNGYKTEDSVLLPALLGFALIGVILIITVCLVARNKRTIVTSVRKRNRNDLEESGAEDNTTLLTNTNLSDED